MYCENCEQNVNEERIIGVGTLLAAIVTCGFWLIAIPFYNKRCPICHGTHFTQFVRKSEKSILGDISDKLKKA